jgi:hypothetical protein
VEEIKKTMEESLMGQTMGRYTVVNLAREWMFVLRRTEEGRKMSDSDIIRQAIDDVVTGRVDAKEIAAAVDKYDNSAEKCEADARELERDKEFSPREIGKPSKKSDKSKR